MVRPHRKDGRGENCGENDRVETSLYKNKRKTENSMGGVGIKRLKIHNWRGNIQYQKS